MITSNMAVILQALKSVSCRGSRWLEVEGTSFRLLQRTFDGKLYMFDVRDFTYKKLADVWEELPNGFKYEISFHLDLFE